MRKKNNLKTNVSKSTKSEKIYTTQEKIKYWENRIAYCQYRLQLVLNRENAKKKGA